MENTITKSAACAIAFALAAYVSLFATLSSAQEQVLNLRDADIRAFVDDVSMLTGRVFIIDPRVRGNVTVISRDAIGPEAVFQVFLSTLRANGFTAVSTSSGAYRIVPEEAAAQDAGPVGLNGTTADTWVTEVFRLKIADAPTVANMLKPMVHPEGVAVNTRDSNIVIVVDYESNMARIRDVIAKVDADQSEIHTIVLENTSADEMARVVLELGGQPGDENRRSRRFSVVPVQSSNTLILRGDPAVIARIVPVIEALDARNETRNDIRVIYLRHAAAEELAPILERLSGSIIAPGEDGPSQNADRRVNITFDKGTNSLIIAADPERQQALEAVIQQLDVRRAQVLVEAIIVEISDTAARELGLQFVLSGSDGSEVPFTATNFSNSAPNILAATGALIVGREQTGDSDALDNLQQAAIDSIVGANGALAGFAGITDGGTLFGVIVNALERDVDSNVLSTPSIMTLDNEAASIIVGQEIPITTGEALGSDNTNPFRTIERQNVGIQLDVRPQISEGDIVRLYIRQEVSAIVGPVSLDFSELIISKREIETTVTVDDGEIIVLGGLIQDDEQISLEKVPLLGDIPGLGKLFQSNARSRIRNNLMVFLRPRILRNVDDLRTVTNLKYNYIQAEDLLQSGGEGTRLDDFVRSTLGGNTPSDSQSGTETSGKQDN